MTKRASPYPFPLLTLSLPFLFTHPFLTLPFYSPFPYPSFLLTLSLPFLFTHPFLTLSLCSPFRLKPFPRCPSDGDFSDRLQRALLVRVPRSCVGLLCEGKVKGERGKSKGERTSQG